MESEKGIAKGDRKMVTFTPASFKRFKKAYAKCEAKSFMFEGDEYVKRYAEYLIEFLEGHFKRREAR